MGVSAGHLDWSMVPYVRKSFAKHYKRGLQYIEQKPFIDGKISEMLHNAANYSIDDEEYKKYSVAAYQYAKDMVEAETKQACEGMYHNLNIWAA